MSKIYIAVLDAVPSHMVPVLVAHSILGAHLAMENCPEYKEWLHNSFKKVVLKVTPKEFDKIKVLDMCAWLGHENTVINGSPTCAVMFPMREYIPNVIKFAKLWKP